ncbi:DUF5719 family protein [Actinomadura roseirufa]|uniref:DUF5719 family protein n=1 Tax=Actinomadura roseirufa TaxID=2094049 RepID=UPI00104119F9|nr:DUF5719 family protein [Actinomadura roseirufa]
MDGLLRLLGLRYATAALVLVALAALYGAASLSRPSATAREKGAHTPVTSAVAVCPGHEDGRVSVQSPAGTAPGGHAEVTATRGGRPLAAFDAPGRGWHRDLAAMADSVTVRARGPLAAGLSAEQTTHWPGGPDRGLAGVRCAVPGTDLWFTGPGPVIADSLDLYLTNVDAQPASVDLTAISDAGPLDTTDGLATPVAPATTRVVRLGRSPEGLGDVLRSARDLALHVRTTGGRVAASLRARLGEGKGIEWVPLSAAPAPALVVPGVPSGPGGRWLLVAVPGDTAARVRVQVITPDGGYAPQGQDVLDAPARSVASLDLAKALSGKPAAVRLVADRPIVAGLVAERGADVAYGTATAPLGPPDGSGRPSSGVVADVRLDSTLTLTAPSGPATVQVTPMAPWGPGTPQTVSVPAGRTVETRLTAPPGSGEGYGAVVTPKPGSSPVYAARTLSTGEDDDYLFTVLPMNPAVTAQWLPKVGDSQTTLND